MRSLMVFFKDELCLFYIKNKLTFSFHFSDYLILLKAASVLCLKSYSFKIFRKLLMRSFERF
jgi:hypothetical protein